MHAEEHGSMRHVPSRLDRPISMFAPWHGMRTAWTCASILRRGRTCSSLHPATRVSMQHPGVRSAHSSARAGRRFQGVHLSTTATEDTCAGVVFMRISGREIRARRCSLVRRWGVFLFTLCGLSYPFSNLSIGWFDRVHHSRHPYARRDTTLPQTQTPRNRTYTPRWWCRSRMHPIHAWQG